MDRERLVDEVLMLLPVLGRGLGRPGREELGEIAERGMPVDARLSPGHVQVLVALGRGPHSIRQLAGLIGVSSPAVTQLVNHLEGVENVQTTSSQGFSVVAIEFGLDVDTEEAETGVRALWRT